MLNNGQVPAAPTQTGKQKPPTLGTSPIQLTVYNGATIKVLIYLYYE